MRTDYGWILMIKIRNELRWRIRNENRTDRWSKQSDTFFCNTTIGFLNTFLSVFFFWKKFKSGHGTCHFDICDIATGINISHIRMFNGKKCTFLKIVVVLSSLIVVRSIKQRKCISNFVYEYFDAFDVCDSYATFNLHIQFTVCQLIVRTNNNISIRILNIVLMFSSWFVTNARRICCYFKNENP